MIEWKLIADLPEELKDGRQVLLWDAGGADVGTWEDLSTMDAPGWIDPYEMAPIENPTHFAEITPPATWPGKPPKMIYTVRGIDDPAPKPPSLSDIARK